MTAGNHDPQYAEICASIRVTDDISFKLLGLVPLLSGSTILAVLLKSEALWSPSIYAFAIFGAVVTFALLRWEMRNIQTCSWLRNRAADIERRALRPAEGLGAFYRRSEPPELVGRRIGKTEAEKIIYCATTFAWLAVPWAVSAAARAKGGSAESSSGLAGSLYLVGALAVAVATLASTFTRIDTTPGPDTPNVAQGVASASDRLL